MVNIYYIVNKLIIFNRLITLRAPRYMHREVSRQDSYLKAIEHFDRLKL
jgi:hypothetical protein